MVVGSNVLLLPVCGTPGSVICAWLALRTLVAGGVDVL